MPEVRTCSAWPTLVHGLPERLATKLAAFGGEGVASLLSDTRTLGLTLPPALLRRVTQLLLPSLPALSSGTLVSLAVALAQLLADGSAAADAEVLSRAATPAATKGPDSGDSLSGTAAGVGDKGSDGQQEEQEQEAWEAQLPIVMPALNAVLARLEASLVGASLHGLHAWLACMACMTCLRDQRPVRGWTTAGYLFPPCCLFFGCRSCFPCLDSRRPVSPGPNMS